MSMFVYTDSMCLVLHFSRKTLCYLFYVFCFFLYFLLISTYFVFIILLIFFCIMVCYLFPCYLSPVGPMSA